MGRVFAIWPQPRFDRLLAWLRQPELQNRLAFVLALAAVLSGIATYVVISGELTIGADVEVVLALLYLDVSLLLLLGVVVARRLSQLYLARRQGSAGSRLHARLVALFGVVAVAPAIVVAVFSVMFLHYGLESWFSERVSNALSNSLTVAQAYLDEHKDVIRADALAMAQDINRDGPSLVGRPELFQRFLDAQAALRSLTEAIVMRGNGEIVARTGLSFVLEMEQPAPELIEQARTGDVVLVTSDSEDRVRALVRLDSFIDAYLFVGRLVDARVLSYLERTREVVDEYRLLELRRYGIQMTFAVIFGVVALLLLLAAVWVGMSFANKLVAPLSSLIGAADRVRDGDLEARVAEIDDDDELGRLSRAFNRMTSQVASQRTALVDANHQLDQRRRFTEAVIAGVSAGVIGLDGRGRITLPNRQASAFFGLPPEALHERPLIAVLPEVGGLLAGVASAPDRPAEGQVELIRNGHAYTLLVRIAAQLDNGAISGYVVTFDDISELLAAQRKAAWAEIARRIAHEIKNPLTPIRLTAERLKRKYLKQIHTDPETFQASTETIIRQVDTIGRLINEFSAFARMPAPVFGLESANELIRQAVHLQEGARPQISFETQLPDREIRLYCDSSQVAQALTNLLQNAVDSITERSRRTDPEGPARGSVRVRLEDDDQHVRIRVEDDGIGLPNDPVDRLTEPYFTTRAHGTGLGLAIVKKIMEEHGGGLVFAGREPAGAAVTLVFPAAHVSGPAEYAAE